MRAVPCRGCGNRVHRGSAHPTPRPRTLGVSRRRLLAEVHVSVPRFNLLSLDMPDQFEQAVIAKVIVEQDVKTLEFKKTSAVTAEETRLEQTKADKDITILRAQVRCSEVCLAPPYPVRGLACHTVAVVHRHSRPPTARCW